MSEPYVVTVGDRAHEIAAWSGATPVALVDGRPVLADALGDYRVETRQEFDARQRAAARQASEAARVTQDAARAEQDAAEAALQAETERLAREDAERRQRALAVARAAQLPSRASGWSPF